MYAVDFIYDGELLSDYGMMIGSLDGSSDDTVSSGADITFNQAKPSGSNKFNLYSSVYDECYTTTFQIIKNPCATSGEMEEIYLSPTLVSQLQRWLCRKNEYKKFKIVQDDYMDLYWNGTFSSKQIELGGKIIGLELTMYTNHPYAFNDEIVLEYNCLEETSFDIYDMSDETGVLYPCVEIKTSEENDTGLTLELINITENKITSVENCLPGETITFYGDSKIIESDKEHDKLPKDFNYIFPRITNNYENRKNTFTVNIPCEIKITYSPVKKIGL